MAALKIETNGEEPMECEPINIQNVKLEPVEEEDEEATITKKNSSSALNVKKEVKKLIKLKDETNKAAIIKSWNSARQIIKDDKDEINLSEITNADAFDQEYKPSEIKEVKFASFGPPRSVKVKVPVHIMDPVECLPEMTPFVMIPHNLFVKDTEVLFNIPYLGENVLKNEVHFINGIIADYAGKIHSDKIKILEDSMFVDLVNALNKSDAMKEPTFSIFHAISNKYPDQGTPEQLRRKYHMLVHGEDAQYSSPYYTPNIDGPNAMSVPFQKSIQSFKRLFCRRCFVYDCLIHPLGLDPWPHERHNFDKLIENNEPCSQNCYKIETENASPHAKWSAADESLFRCIQRVCLDNFCAIAKTLNTKTCRQVYDFAIKDGVQMKPEIDESTVFKRPQVPKLTLKRGKGSSSFQLQKTLKKVIGKVVPHYIPCGHTGICTSENCSCFVNGSQCDKFCLCLESCPNRFLPCKCRGECNSNSCGCFMASRECDPDRCRACGSNEMDNEKRLCKNVNIQYRLDKNVKIGKSSVSGYGAFVLEPVETDEFVIEYCGEIISDFETERRGKLYDKRGVSYIFQLNAKYSLDATDKGNISRFFNHSATPNCRPKVIMVNGDHRIGFFALKPIKADEELFFDYGYNEEAKSLVAVELNPVKSRSKIKSENSQ